MSGNRPGDPDFREPHHVAEQVVERGPGEGTLESAIPPLSESIVAEVPESSFATNVPSRTPWEVLWLKLRRNKAAMTALWVLVVFYATIPISGFLAPYNYATQ